MKFQITNNEPLQFYNANGDLVGTIEISGSGDMILRPESGSSKNIIIGDTNTAADIQMGLVSAPINLELLGGGTITSNGNTLNIGADTDTVNIRNAVYSQSIDVTGSLNVSGSVFADNFIGTVLSASYALTASHALNGGGGGSVPAGTVSGSAQITALGFVTSSATASFSNVVANPGSSGGGALSTVTIDGTNFSVGGGGGGSSIFTAGSGFQKTINNLIISESNATSSLTVINSGSTVFDVQGSVGQLFEVQDGLDGVLMSVNDISGIPILTVSSSGDVFLAAGSTLQGTAATASFVPGVSAAFPFTGSGAISGSLNINGSGSGIFDVDGTVGQLFSVNDGLDGILMSVNDISGLPLFEVSSSGDVEIHSGNISGSAASTASFGHLLVNGVSISGSSGGGGGGGSVPAGTVSGSGQITALGFVTSSATASFVTNSQTGSFLTNASTASFNNLNITHPDGNLIPGNGSTSSIAVTVVNDGANRYVLDGEKTGSLTLVAGNAYKFDTSDSSNNGHPFAFKLASDSSTSYTTGVTVNGSGYTSPDPGQAGAYVQISVTNDTPDLIYYCTVHGNGMGGGAILSIQTGSVIQTGFLQVTGSVNILSGSITVNSGSFIGDGSGLTGLVSASIAQTASFISSTFISASAAASGFGSGGGGGTPTFIASGSTSASAAPDTGVVVEHSGSTAFSVIGDVGTLFSVDDDLTGTLLSINDITGIPMFEVSASGRIVAEEGEAIIRSQRPIVTVGTNPFTASADNVGQYFRVGGNVTCSIFVSASVSCPIGAEFDFFQTSSAGNMLFETGSGVTLNSKNGNLNLAGQFSSATLKYVNNDEWDLIGDLT